MHGGCMALDAPATAGAMQPCWSPLCCRHQHWHQASPTEPDIMLQAAQNPARHTDAPLTSVHISFTFSRIMLQCLSNALTRPSSLWLLRQLISTCRASKPVQTTLLSFQTPQGWLPKRS